MLKYKYKKFRPAPSITLHTESLTLLSRTKDLALRILTTKKLFLSSSRGPSQVEKRLVSNLRQIVPPDNVQIDWVLNVNSKECWEDLTINFENLILGPNIEFERSYIKERISSSRNSIILVPSEWVIPVLSARIDWFKGRFIVWQSDIDTSYWKPARREKKKYVLIYRKNDQSEDDYSRIVRSCEELGLRYKVITYGRYSQNSFRRSIRKSKFAIWLGTTESQGIALLECWAVNVPTFVRTRNQFLDDVSGRTFESSSAPYLNESCGEFFDASTFSTDTLRHFRGLSDSLKPRIFVLQNYSKSRVSTDLMKILKALNP